MVTFIYCLIVVVLLSMAMATTPVIIISLRFSIPTVSMFVATMIAFPVSGKIPVFIVARRHPSRSAIG